MKPLRLAIIGCGHICQQYGTHIQKHSEHLQIAGATDLDFSRAEAFCAKYGGKAYDSFEAILSDPDVDVVVNLTVHHAHFELNSRALKAGKHVFTEKPMALTYAQAVELAKIAQENNRRLGAAPVTFLGEGIQTTAKFLEADKLGPLRLVYAEVNWGQIERWISAPAPYYTVGPLLDVGVYAITALTFLLGPVRRVWGYSTILKSSRSGKDGQEVSVTAPDFTTGMMEFASGVVARITTNYYVPNKNQAHLRGFEFHGDEGTFSVSDYHGFSAKCRFIPYHEEPVAIPLLRPAADRMDRALGLVEMAEAIHENRPHRGSPDHASHVIEIMEGLQKSSDESRFVEIHSTLQKPALMPWAQKLSLVIPEEHSTLSPKTL